MIGLLGGLIVLLGIVALVYGAWVRVMIDVDMKDSED